MLALARDNLCSTRLMALLMALLMTLLMALPATRIGTLVAVDLVRRS
jgi:hypothetical protein